MGLIIRLFKPIFIKIYGFWLLSKNQIKQQLALGRDKISLILANREVIHLALGIVAILVSSTNVLQAKDAQANYGEKTLLAQIVEDAENEEIVESGLPTAHTSFHYLENEPAYRANLAMKEDTETAQALTTNSGSLVKTNVLGTESGARGDVVEYTVQGGDTVSTIAERYGVSTNTILWANDISASSYVKPGQVLKIPPTTGVVYTVKSGDTLDSIVKKYSANLDETIEYNKLADASAISEGDTIVIPNGEVPAPPPTYNTPSLGTIGDLFRDNSPYDGSTSGGWVWPTNSKRITPGQYFRYKHTGIDIDGTWGDPIYAAKAGKVITAGWYGSYSWCGGYGKFIEIDHGNGFHSRYGHLQSIYVQSGQYVNAGATIGEQGDTGCAWGAHLHFEIKLNGSFVNPLNYISP